MSRPGWGYHYGPCQGSGGGGFAGFVAAVILAAVFLYAVARPAARAAGEVGHAVLRGLEIAAVTVGCVAGMAVTYVAARAALRVYRWHVARTAPPAALAAKAAHQLPAGRAMIEEGRPVVTATVLASDYAERRP